MYHDISRLRSAVDAVYEDVVALRRHIHMHPELSNEERETMNFVSAYLTELGSPHQTNVGGYGIVATIGDSKADFAVAVRADMDALPIQEKNEVPYASVVPGVMHACGLTTLAIPSAPQKRPWAKGRSREMQSTTVLGSEAASSLNLRTEVAHTPVSMLGKMFITTYLPLHSLRVKVLRSPFTR